MEPLEPTYQEFTELLTEAELNDLARLYGAAHQRERKLPLRIFFWLMVLSASQPTARGGLFQLAAFFVGALTPLFPLPQAIPHWSQTLWGVSGSGAAGEGSAPAWTTASSSCSRQQRE